MYVLLLCAFAPPPPPPAPPVVALPLVRPALPPLAVPALPVMPAIGGSAGPRLAYVEGKGDGFTTRDAVPVYKTVEKEVAVATPGGGIEKRKVTVTEVVMETKLTTHSLKGATVTTADGKKLDAEAVKKALANPQVAVLSEGGAVDAAFLKALKPETLVIVKPASATAPVIGPGVRPVPLPRPIIRPLPRPGIRPLPLPVPPVVVPDRE